MSKYRPLATYLNRQTTDVVVMSFAHIERIVGGLLPKASHDPAWWTADAGSVQPQQRILAESGFRAEPDYDAETVRFTRAEPVGDDAAQTAG